MNSASAATRRCNPTPKPLPVGDHLDRFQRLIVPASDGSGCLIWVGPIMSNGYGKFDFRVDGVHVQWLAHRLAYELKVGPIPFPLTLDHLCRNRRCVNAAEHLEPVTRGANTLRGESLSAQRARQEFCKRGHALVPENLYPEKGRPNSRVCKLCKRAAQKTPEMRAKHAAYERDRRAELRETPRVLCDAVIRNGRQMGKVCGATASLYDAASKRNLCKQHRTDNAVPGSGPSWYDEPVVPARVDGFDAALPTDMCESDAHPNSPRRAKAIKNGVALCLLCSFDAELAELRAFMARGPEAA